MRDGYLHLFIQIDGTDYIRLITKSWRISYRKLIVNNIRKAVFFSQLCIAHFFLITSSHLSLELRIPLNSSNQFIGEIYQPNKLSEF